MQYVSYEEIIENIKRITAEKGMKQGIVGERSGFTPQEFSNILNDRRKLLRVEHLMPIANALGVSVDSLYYPKGKCEVSNLNEIRRNNNQ